MNVKIVWDFVQEGKFANPSTVPRRPEKFNKSCNKRKYLK